MDTLLQTKLFGSTKLMAVMGRLVYFELGAASVLAALKIGGVL